MVCVGEGMGKMSPQVYYNQLSTSGEWVWGGLVLVCVGEGMGRRGGASPQQTAEHNNMVAATNMAEALQAMHGGSLRYD